ncbi:SH3 domain-containing C40 family peptidase [Paenibacillus dokdonensis]|uniref:SH3 domain-containing C40 family peptidase n=1 Tax=Paenibacillus dokdonensis TaxID=2567944 RepID=A0ABU6GL33_9BACL|nr:SH3 domain-containing C40 family peptidase [Paenibacillus dokdonensis]MEC0238867.1 SH3 domain-containing C40 family peptidase [Paenibacillus dokdonensis]
MINIKKSLLGSLAITAAVSAALILPSPSHAAASKAVVQSASQTGVIQSSVNLRDKPSLSSHVLGLVKTGEQVKILEKSNAYFCKIKTAAGKTGYISTADKYIRAGKASSGSSSSNSSSGSSNSQSNGSSSASKPAQSASAAIEKVIRTGMKYLGTPYEYGSDRNTTKTFDCSDFIRQIFKEGAGLTLPADSRQQGSWIKDNRSPVYSTNQLKRGDLVFFMSYKGSSSSAYQGINKSKQQITHVALYLGDGKLLHTYSKQAGGVVVTDFTNSWKYRFLYGGSVLK